MDKFAFYRYAGRELGLRYMTVATADQIEKTASAGQEVDQVYIDQVNDFAGSIAYSEELQKMAAFQGRIDAYGDILNALRAEGADLNKIANQLEQAMQHAPEVADGPMPQEEGDVEGMQDEMIAGVAEAISSVTGQDPNDPEVIELAIELVENELTGSAE